jgi:hypothetical protein
MINFPPWSHERVVLVLALELVVEADDIAQGSRLVEVVVPLRLKGTRLMEKTRGGLERLSIELKRPHGPGAAAQGLLRSRLKREDARAILGNIVMGDDDAANGEDEEDPFAIARGFERALDAAMTDFEPDEAAQGKLWREALKCVNRRRTLPLDWNGPLGADGWASRN